MLRTIVDDMIRAILIVIVTVVLFAASLVGLAYTDISGHCDTVRSPSSTIVICAMPIAHWLLPQQEGK